MVAISSLVKPAPLQPSALAKQQRRSVACQSASERLQPDTLKAVPHEYSLPLDPRARAFYLAGMRNAERIGALYTAENARLETKALPGTHAHDLRTFERHIGHVDMQTRDALYFDVAYEFLNKTIGAQSGRWPLSVPKPMTKEVQAIAFEHLRSLARTFAKTSDRNMRITFPILRKYLHPTSALMPSQRQQLARSILDRRLEPQTKVENTAKCRYIRLLARNAQLQAHDLSIVAQSVEVALGSNSPMHAADKTALAWVAAGTSRSHEAFTPVHEIAFAHLLALAKAVIKLDGVEFLDAFDRSMLAQAFSPGSPLHLEQKKQIASELSRHPKAPLTSAEALALMQPLSAAVHHAVERAGSDDVADRENTALARHILRNFPATHLQLLDTAEKLQMLYVT